MDNKYTELSNNDYAVQRAQMVHLIKDIAAGGFENDHKIIKACQALLKKLDLGFQNSSILTKKESMESLKKKNRKITGMWE